MIKVEAISKNFGGVQALKDVGAEFVPGEVHALMGENGAGKSTLGKIVAGVYPPSVGTIELEGRTVSFATTLEAQRAGICMIFQELDLFPNLSVAENMVIGNLNASANDANRGATPTTAVAKVPENVRVQAKRSLLASGRMSMGEKKAKRKKRTSTRGRCRLGRLEPKKHVWCYVDVSGRRVRECGKFVEWDLAAEGHPPKAKRTKTSETAKTAKKPKV